MTTEIVKYEAAKAVGSKRTLQALLETQMDSIRAVMPVHLTPDRLLKTLFLAVNRQPKLLECTQESVLQAIVQTAELGLDLSPSRGEAYLVPFKGKVQFIPGFRGLAKLARQAKPQCRIEAELVYKHDHFEYVKGTDPRVEFRPKLDGERGPVIGAYALFQPEPGSPVQADYMSVADLDAIRARSMAANSGPWVTDTGEMRRKTVWRRLSKWVPLSSDTAFAKALEADDTALDFSAVDMREPEADGDRTKKLAQKLSGEDPPVNEVTDALFDATEGVGMEQEAKSAETCLYFRVLFEKADSPAALDSARAELGDPTPEYLLPEDRATLSAAYKDAVSRVKDQ